MVEIEPLLQRVFSILFQLLFVLGMERATGGTLYVTCFPCLDCAKLIIQAVRQRHGQHHDGLIVTTIYILFVFLVTVTTIYILSSFSAPTQCVKKVVYKEEYDKNEQAQKLLQVRLGEAVSSCTHACLSLSILDAH